MNMKQKIARKIKRLFDPVVQDHGAIMFGDYKGQSVLLRPVLSPCDQTRIERWVPDPEVVMAVEEEMAIERMGGVQK